MKTKPVSGIKTPSVLTSTIISLRTVWTVTPLSYKPSGYILHCVKMHPLIILRDLDFIEV